MNPSTFVGLLGLATIIIGVFSMIFNDKTTGLGLITAGLSDEGIAVALAQRTTSPPQQTA